MNLVMIIVVEILILILGVFLSVIIYDLDWEFLIAFATIGLLIVTPLVFGDLFGYINYEPSNDRDKARIIAVTQEQTIFKTYYKVEVEYLTNTPTQEGVTQNRNIEKDTFYCYFTDKELVEKLKNNQYKELWIISGYKGGYETFKDFGNKLVKDIELIEVEN